MFHTKRHPFLTNRAFHPAKVSIKVESVRLFLIQTLIPVKILSSFNKENDYTLYIRGAVVCRLLFLNEALEGQIVSTTLAYRFLCRREGRRGILRSSSLCERSALDRSASYGSSTTYHIEGTDIIEPTAIELMGIDIERNGDILTHLDIELLDAIFTENTEDTLLGILTGNLYDIVL
jgi:hypothetical protein